MNFKLIFVCSLLLFYLTTIKSDLDSCKDSIEKDVQSCTQGKLMIPANNFEEECNNSKILVNCNREVAKVFLDYVLVQFIK